MSETRRLIISIEYPADLAEPPPMRISIGRPASVGGPPQAPGPFVEDPYPRRRPKSHPNEPQVAQVVSLNPLAGEGAWEASEEARSAFFPSAIDSGQHDHWKREAALVVWRVLMGPEAPVSRRMFDLDGTGRAGPSGALFPLHQDLTQTSARLGFVRLFWAALGFDGEVGEQLVRPSEFPCAGPFTLAATPELPTEPIDVQKLLYSIAVEHGAAVNTLLLTFGADAAEVEGSSDEARAAARPYRDTELLLRLSPGDVDGWERPDLAGCPPLRGLRFGGQSPAGTPRTGARLGQPPTTPATGAPLPDRGPEHTAEDTPAPAPSLKLRTTAIESMLEEPPGGSG